MSGFGYLEAVIDMLGVSLTDDLSGRVLMRDHAAYDLSDSNFQPGLADVLPLSPLQEGLLFHARYDDRGADLYNVQVALDLRGPLDAAALRDAAAAVVRRHDTLRAAFPAGGSGQPVQVVPREVELPWTELEALLPERLIGVGRVDPDAGRARLG